MANQLGLNKAIVHCPLTNFYIVTCDYRCSKRSNLRKHIEANHENKKPHKCTICAYSFFWKKKWLEKTYWISLWGKEILHMQHLWWQIFSKRQFEKAYWSNSWEQEVTQVLSLCLQLFWKKWFEKNIQSVHERKKPFICNTYDYRGSLRGHLKRSLTRSMILNSVHGDGQCCPSRNIPNPKDIPISREK